MSNLAPKSPPVQPPIVGVDDVTCLYHVGGREVRALDQVSLAVNQGEHLCLVGPSGSGKTTLFNLISGMDSPSEGTISCEGRDLAQLSAKQLSQLRCLRIGYIFQNLNLVPTLTAEENVMLPMLFAGATRKAARPAARALLARVGLDDRSRHIPSALSGGQQQRVAVARALANQPAIVLADEPTGNLDPESAAAVLALLLQAHVRDGVTLITATHDPTLIESAQRIVRLQNGRIVADDRTL